MSFQTPITIKTALERIRGRDYVLPAIQREFVWRTPQICALFDSLMQGYPIGSFLFWNVTAEHSHEYVFYGFLRDYHQLTGKHCPVLDLPDKRPVVAILDGQQRLTALNIGLRGSHTEKEPRKWWNNPSAYKRKTLHLNLCSLAADNDQGLKYDFRFLRPDKAGGQRDDDTFWFPVAHAYDMKGGREVHPYLRDQGLADHPLAYDVLYDLWLTVNERAVVPYFAEEEQDLDKVLNIFIRVNSGGTPLSYSDLLLSIATAQWTELDARQEIHALVDELNATRWGFRFSKDLVLKAGLMLTGIPSIGFRVTNFNARNMRTMEEHWPRVAAALRVGTRLLADFGFSATTMSADSVLLPVAHYLYRRQLDERFLTTVGHQADRDRVRDWVVRSLVRGGIWGSGLDGLLLALRAAIDDHGAEGFPTAEIERAMAGRGKDLRFAEEHIEHLLDSGYGHRGTFALLSLLYPGFDFHNEFHVDHVFPHSRFTKSRLRKAEVPESDIDDFRDMAERLANLQLLEGPRNQSKNAKMPAVWLGKQYPDAHARDAYRARHDLGELPEDISAFRTFYEQRQARMAARLRIILNVPEPTTP